MKVEAELLRLIQRSRQGDRTAQDELVRAVQNRVYYHCKKMLKKEEDALDATQDVLLAVLTGLDSLREPAAFWGWVNSITANRCRRALGSPHKEWQLPEDEEGNSLLDSLESLDETLLPDKALDNEETRRMIIGLVDGLPPEQRLCVLFYYYDEMSVREIAQAMDTSEGTVKSRLNYARRSIKKGVEDYERKGIKLYGVSPLLLLVFALRQEAASSALNSGAAAALAARVELQAGGAAAVGGETAAGAAAGSAGAGTGSAAGAAVSAKVIAGIVAGAVAVGAAAVGVPAVLGRSGAEESPAPVAETVPAPTPEATLPPEELPFGEAHGFVIVEPQAFEGLPVELILEDPALVPLPSSSAVTSPEISVTQPDGEGYVTYTVTYEVTARSHLGTTGGGGEFSCTILAQDYNLYDYYTGRLYLPDQGERGPDGETRTSGSAVVEHNGGQMDITYQKNWSSGMDMGSWAASGQPELTLERYIDSYMTAAVVIRAPADYDGLLLGINVVDPGDSSQTVEEAWDLSTMEPSHYRFIRLEAAD